MVTVTGAVVKFPFLNRQIAGEKSDHKSDHIAKKITKVITFGTGLLLSAVSQFYQHPIKKQPGFILQSWVARLVTKKF